MSDTDGVTERDRERTIDRTYRMPWRTLRRLDWLAQQHHGGVNSRALRAAIDTYYEQEGGPDDAPTDA